MESQSLTTVGHHPSKDAPQVPTMQVSFMKNPKRKRLAKACDACHKSKRRCDGTAPCSNCFFASKDCTYTDASGRPVPAPKAPGLAIQSSKDNHRTVQPALSDSPILPPQVIDAFKAAQPKASLPHSANSYPETAVNNKKRSRSGSDNEEAVTKHRLVPPGPNYPLAGLKTRLMKELICLFFAHCHPHQMIIHKPSFTIALRENTVPPYLVLAMCATAAPFSKNPQVRNPLPHTAGIQFHQEAVKMMFDPTGRLVCESNLSTVQALCLLEMHEVNAHYSWTNYFKYLELASKMLLDDIQVQKPDTYILSTSLPSRDLGIHIEKECLRRCFWMVYFIDVLCTTYTRKSTRFPSSDISIKLPIDETSFDLGIHRTSSEYLTQPAARTDCASEFGHVIRILTICAKAEDFMASGDDATIRKGMLEVEQNLDDWKASLPNHLRFSEENLEIHQSMFETESSAGAWCFYFMHSCHATCALTSAKAKYSGYDSSLPEHMQTKDCINKILSSLGRRAKNSNWLVASILWPLSKDFSDDSDFKVVDDDYESIWGYRTMDTAAAWMKHNRAARKMGGRLDRLQPPGACAIRTWGINKRCLSPTVPGGWRYEERRGSVDGREGVGTGRERNVGNDRPPPSLPSLKSVGLLETRSTSELTEILTSLPPLSGTPW